MVLLYRFALASLASGMREGVTVGDAVSDRSWVRIRPRGGLLVRGDLPGEAERSVGQDEG